jgi:anti-anti-sigma regulatory factor
MLRISVDRDTESTVLTVEGKIMSPWVRELEKCWDSAKSGKPIIVKLAAVTFIDSTGRELLTRMRRNGARIEPTGCFMKAVVEAIEAEAFERKS